MEFNLSLIDLAQAQEQAQGTGIPILPVIPIVSSPTPGLTLVGRAGEEMIG